jgi:hypothetical protein
MIEISIAWVGACIVWFLFGVLCFTGSFWVAFLTQFGDDEKKVLNVSMVFATICTVLYFFLTSGIFKFVD